MIILIIIIIIKIIKITLINNNNNISNNIVILVYHKNTNNNNNNNNNNNESGAIAQLVDYTLCLSSREVRGSNLTTGFLCGRTLYVRFAKNAPARLFWVFLSLPDRCVCGGI